MAPSPVVGLGGLCLGSECSDAESEADRDTMSYGLDLEATTPPPGGLLPSFPVQILPNLYLGSARDSANVESLAKLGIRYILNVTPNLPNLFEKNGDFHYKQIPISDHWSQNLSQFFPEAIAFIGESTSSSPFFLLPPGQAPRLSHFFSLSLMMAPPQLSCHPQSPKPRWYFWGWALLGPRVLSLGRAPRQTWPGPSGLEGGAGAASVPPEGH